MSERTQVIVVSDILRAALKMRAIRAPSVALAVAVWALLGSTTAADQQFRLKVVEPTAQISQAVQAVALSMAEAVAAEGDEPLLVDVGRAALEPGEPLDLPRHVCIAADEGFDAVLTGMEGVGAATEAAAARAGVLLLALGGGAGATGAEREALALYPHEDVALDAARDICQEKGWSEAVLLHTSSARPIAALAPDGDRMRLLARQLPREDEKLRELLLVLKKEEHVNFIVWSDASVAARVLDMAQVVGLLSTRHSYVVLSLELHTQPLHDYSFGGANITGFMSFDPWMDGTVQEVVDTVRGWPEQHEDSLPAPALDATNVSSGLLLARHAADMTARALRYLQLPAIDATASCDLGVGAFHADTLLNFLRSEKHPGGLTWDADGARREVVLQVVELVLGGRLERAGRWRRGEGVTWQRPPVYVPPMPTDSMTNRTFNILIAINKPYVMRKENVKRLLGNDQYEGFCIELIERLASILNFNYTFIEMKNGTYGDMLKKLYPGSNIDFAITDLTITAEREKLVDFTTPFMNLGISILFRKPKPPEPRLWAFLLPFSSGVWLCLGVAYVGTSLVLYVVGRLCPEEWQNPYPCIEEPAALENQFTLANALWFNVGAVLLQGSEIAPVAYGSRTVASMWWMFALVITSSYTANLATLLAKKSSSELISNVNDLAYNTDDIKYGAKSEGATYTFFAKSDNELFRHMHEHMKAHEKEMPDSNDKGVQMVAESPYKYAFLMESTSIEYEVERNCAVTQVGDLLDSKGYGIAMMKNSPYRQALNLALLRLQEQGELREMKHTWWEERHGGGACKVTEQAEAEKLDMKSFYGLFIVLVVGCALGVVLSCCDLALHARRHPRDPARAFRHNFAHELRFVFRFEQSAKPLEGPLFESKQSSAQSSAASELEVGGAAEAEGEGEEQAPAEEAEALRNESGMSARRRRRRSSMHNASVRLARHARD